MIKDKLCKESPLCSRSSKVNYCICNSNTRYYLEEMESHYIQELAHIPLIGTDDIKLTLILKDKILAIRRKVRYLKLKEVINSE